MPLGKGGYKYIVDLRDKFTGWIEAKKTKRVTSAFVADFIFEVMCRFGCLVKLTVDNGSEFKGAVVLLAEKYKLPLIPISPYNPPANGVVERGHAVYINSIWKAVEGETSLWPLLLNQALWADRITAKRTTGCSPYFLLYGQAPTLSWDITDRSWHALEWHKVNTTQELLTLRIKQLSRRDEFIGETSVKLETARKKAADDFYEKNKARMMDHAYEPGMFVLVWNNYLDFQFGNKGALRWMGPYIVVQRRSSGAYVLAELDGAVLAKPVAARRIKLYHYRNIEKPIIRFKWRSRIEDKYNILDEDEEDLVDSAELQDFMAAKVKARKVRRREGPDVKHPWELRGEEATKYWMQIEEDWKSGEMAKRAAENLPSRWEEAAFKWYDEECKPFWDYSWDYKDFDIEDIPRWITPPKEKSLFVWKHGKEWLPPGPPTFASQSKSALVVDVFGTTFEPDQWAVLGTARMVTICGKPKKATGPIDDNGRENGTIAAPHPKTRRARQRLRKKNARKSVKGRTFPELKLPPPHFSTKQKRVFMSQPVDDLSAHAVPANATQTPRQEGTTIHQTSENASPLVLEDTFMEGVDLISPPDFASPPQVESPLTVTLTPREFEQIEQTSQRTQIYLERVQTRQRYVVDLFDQLKETLQDVEDELEDIEVDIEEASRDFTKLVSTLRTRQRAEWDAKQRQSRDNSEVPSRVRKSSVPSVRVPTQRTRTLNTAEGSGEGRYRVRRNREFEEQTTFRRRNLRSAAQGTNTPRRSRYKD
jgi:hypothetical protein